MSLSHENITMMIFTDLFPSHSTLAGLKQVSEQHLAATNTTSCPFADKHILNVPFSRINVLEIFNPKASRMFQINLEHVIGSETFYDDDRGIA